MFLYYLDNVCVVLSLTIIVDTYFDDLEKI